MSANEQRAVISIELYLYLVAIQRIPYLKSFNSSEIKQGTKYKVFFLTSLYFYIFKKNINQLFCTDKNVLNSKHAIILVWNTTYNNMPHY